MTREQGDGARTVPDPQARAGPPTQSNGGTSGTQHYPEVDWEAAAHSPEFRELVRKRRSFVIPATIFFFVWYFGFIILAGYAEDFMGREFITDGFTVGYFLALTQFIMTWGLAAWYLRRSDRVFDPLAHRAAERAIQVGTAADRPGPGGRPDREPAPRS
jgi:uncharacterized membrane protein (DUF485 family)